MGRGHPLKCSSPGQRIPGESGWLVLKEEGHVFRVEGAGPGGARLPKVNEDMTPCVLWILGLNLYIKYCQRITEIRSESVGKGMGKWAVGEL